MENVEVLLGQVKSDLVTALCEKTEVEQKLCEMERKLEELENELAEARKATAVAGPSSSPSLRPMSTPTNVIDASLLSSVDREKTLEKQIAELSDQLEESQKHRKAAEVREESTLEMLHHVSSMLNSDSNTVSDANRAVSASLALDKIGELKSQLEQALLDREHAIKDLESLRLKRDEEKQTAVTAAIEMCEASKKQVEVLEEELDAARKEQEKLLNKVEELQMMVEHSKKQQEDAIEKEKKIQEAIRASCLSGDVKNQMTEALQFGEMDKAVTLICEAKAEIAALQDLNESLEARLNNAEGVAKQAELLQKENEELRHELSSVKEQFEKLQKDESSFQHAMTAYLDVKLKLAVETSEKEAVSKKCKTAEQKAANAQKQLSSQTETIQNLKVDLETAQCEIAALRANQLVQTFGSSEAASESDPEETSSISPQLSIDTRRPSTSFVPYSALLALELRLAETNKTLADLRCAHDESLNARAILEEQLEQALAEKVQENEITKGELQFQTQVMHTTLSQLAKKLNLAKSEEKALRKSMSIEKGLNTLVEDEEEDELNGPTGPEVYPELLGCDARTPPLISRAQAGQIQLCTPTRYHYSDWQLVYSSVMHGCSYNTLMNTCSRKGPTIVIVRDTKGNVFGGYASESWRESDSYYGTGETFVFSVCDDASMDGEATPGQRRVQIFKWSKKNTFYQLSRSGTLAFGGGGAFAFCINRDIQSGSSGNCETFDSPCLSTSDIFSVEEIQIFGMDSVINRN